MAMEGTSLFKVVSYLSATVCWSANFVTTGNKVSKKTEPTGEGIDQLRLFNLQGKLYMN